MVWANKHGEIYGKVKAIMRREGVRTFRKGG